MEGLDAAQPEQRGPGLVQVGHGKGAPFIRQRIPVQVKADTHFFEKIIGTVESRGFVGSGNHQPFPAFRTDGAQQVAFTAQAADLLAQQGVIQALGQGRSFLQQNDGILFHPHQGFPFLNGKDLPAAQVQVASDLACGQGRGK